MPSPFPGMDPYLEQYWRDVHTSMIVYARDQLQSRLPSDLRARVEERVVVESPVAEPRGVFPDVRVFETDRAGGQTAPAPAWQTSKLALPGQLAGGTAAAPLLLDVRDEPTTETFLEIREVGAGHRLITAIEVLSVTNKFPGEGQEKYLLKRSELLAGGVNLVEIDLLRSGIRVEAAPLEAIPPAQRTPYYACVRRATRLSKAEVYPIALRERLPTIRIPLRAKDADALLDLQALIDECWGKGGYDDIDYSVPPIPPLWPQDAAWAESVVRGRGGA